MVKLMAVKPVPEGNTEVMRTGPCPVLVTVEVSGVLLPTLTLPKFKVEGLSVR